ncbi:probable palmitoyltransferase ZDHHC24 [Dendroctonus ponderosae]|uniref:probable palmitoyltransferase ZDHHC24 n=1 Tax=Dendroctonus ponderosae TaxID=77166 RepID=UPI0020364FE7|nr:probable palmitoyltransferase ZDHHC24 [Dendroctonus ponderosae]KAH1010769.1 hypothetical protein HUJ05_005015 [Dendroctonus ponderosae]
MNIRLDVYPKSWKDACVTAFLLVIIPVIYYFELYVVLPTFYPPWGLAYLFHFAVGHFILFNLCSNLLAIVLIDTSIAGKMLPTDGVNWHFCSVCETFVPARSYHCPTCNVCILKRDHHCMFTSCCIGHYNHRFFLVFVLYVFIAILYSTVYNVQYIYQFITFDSYLSLLKIVFPLTMLFVKWTSYQLQLSLVIVGILGCLFTGVLLYYHLNLILNGFTTHERGRQVSVYDQGKMNNLKIALGNRWYLVWISPCIDSVLPCDGAVWTTNLSTKGK